MTQQKPQKLPPSTLDMAISNMKEIIRVCPNTYAAYVAQVTLNHLETTCEN